MSKKLTENQKLLRQVKKMSIVDTNEYQDYKIYTIAVLNPETNEFGGWKYYAFPPKHKMGSHPVFQSGEKPITKDNWFEEFEKICVAIAFANYIDPRGRRPEEIMENALKSHNETTEMLSKINKGEDGWNEISISITDAVNAVCDAFNNEDYYVFTRKMYWFVRMLVFKQCSNLTKYDVEVTERNKQ